MKHLGRRHLRGETLKEAPGRRHLGGIIWDEASSGGTQEASRRHPGGTQETPRSTQEAPRRHPEAPRRHPGGQRHLGGTYVLFSKSENLIS